MVRKRSESGGAGKRVVDGDVEGWWESSRYDIGLSLTFIERE